MYNWLNGFYRVIRILPYFGYSCTRGRDKLHLFRPQTDFGRNTLQFRGAQLYNGLPSSIRVLKNLTAFRRACISYFKEPS